MKIKERAFTANGLIVWLVLSSAFCGTGAALRTLYAEELCYGTFSTKLNLLYHNSAILTSLPTGPLDCKITLQTERDKSVVIAFYKYNLGPDDRLTFRDIHNFQLSIEGEGFFLDERKSILFEGPLTIHYVTNDTYGSNRLKFQLVYTQVHDAPCSWDEFKCRNNKCIPKELACDRHNHCGQVIDQDDCSTLDKGDVEKVVVTTYSNPWMIAIIVCGALLFLVVITFTIMFIRNSILKEKKENQSQLPPAAPAPNIQNVAPPSALGRIRQSFRSVHQSNASAQRTASASSQTPENYAVPSMYPQLPSAPGYHGIDNPEFKADV